MDIKFDKLMSFFQRLGKAIMTPIAALPVAAVMLRLGQPDVWGHTLFGGNGIPWMVAAGEAVMDNINLIFAIGIAVGLADENNGTAGLSGAIGYFVFTNVAHSFARECQPYILEECTFDMGIFAGILTGIMAGVLYNKYKEIRLPEFLGFFGGRRFIPIITSLTMVSLGIMFGYIWPAMQENISSFGNMIATSGVLGAFIFGFLNRLLIPFGLHHVLNSMFWFQFGQFTNARGEIVSGDIMRFLSGDVTAGTFLTGFFPIMMFGLPAICIAMILAAKKENRKLVSGMLLSVAFTSFLTGITEPIEFLFLFLSPVLFVIHALLTGMSLALTSFWGMRHGYSFSAGLIDYILNYNLAEKPILLLIVGLIIGIVYFIIFYTYIIKFNLNTPGRNTDNYIRDESECEVKSLQVLDERRELQEHSSNKDTKYICDTNNDIVNVGGIDDELFKMLQRDIESNKSNKSGEVVIKPLKSKIDRLAEGIVEGVGGINNILYVDACVTRVRLKLKEIEKVDKDKLKAIGAIEIIGLGRENIQVIIGTMADPIVSKILKIMNNK